MLNLNVGILGHVDSGKTTLAKALSAIASTAAFDKNPQSQQRGITLDLGFSALQVDLPSRLQSGSDEKLQFTFVDCPGHSSLIRTIIGGAQIIDMMVLVVDIGKGIQTQTAECLVIGELTCRRMVVALNKVDTVEEGKRGKIVEKMKRGVGAALEKTVFTGSPIVEISAGSGQGTVCTGTVLQGQIRLNEDVEIPSLKVLKKVKSMQMFKQSQQIARQGDRVGICITQFDPKLLERGLLCRPGYVMNVYAAAFRLNRIKYFKGPLKDKAKFHITCGHETVMGKIMLLKGQTSQHEFVEQLDENQPEDSNAFIIILIEFERPIQAAPNALVIGSRLDTDIHSNTCRLAFYGHLAHCCTNEKEFHAEFLPKLNIYKEKRKVGVVQRVVSDEELIVSGLFKKEGNYRQAFVGLAATLDTGEGGLIGDTFGAGSKVRLRLTDRLREETMSRLKQKGEQVTVEVKYKKFMFQKDGGNKIVQ
ncbi:hypothetical protein quinque_004088 [Culex quinquefasciatus]